MKYRKYFASLFAVWFVLACLLPLQALEVTKQLGNGITYYQKIETAPGCEMVINVVNVDRTRPGVEIKAAIGQDRVMTDDWRKGRETLSSFTGRTDTAAGINADYFPYTGDPLGTCIANCELVSEPAYRRAALAVSKKDGIFIDNPILNATVYMSGAAPRQIDGINRPRETNQVILYTDTYARSTQGKYKGINIVLTSADMPVRLGRQIEFTVTEVIADALDTPIPKGGAVLSAGGPAANFLAANLKPGDALSMRFDFKSPAGYDWTQVEQAVGGGPWLLKNGEVYIDAEEESIKPNVVTPKHPRSAAGVTQDGNLILVTVDGRQAISGGMTLKETAQLLKCLGAVNAMNLDGGGSTVIASRGIILNSPSDGNERPVANALLIQGKQIQTQELPELRISGIDSSVALGQGVQLYLTWGEDSQCLTEDQLRKVIWGTTGGAGFVNQAGYFVPRKAGKAVVWVIYGSQKVKFEVEVVEPAPLPEPEPVSDIPVVTDQASTDKIQE